MHGRTVLIFALFLATVAGSRTNTQVKQTPPTSATERFEAVRDALGGAEALGRVQSLLLVGERRSRNQFFGQAPPDTAPEYTVGRREMRILLPDHYLRSQVIMPSVPVQRSGFAGRTVIAGHPDLGLIQQELGYLVFSLLARTDSAFPFVLREASGNILRFTNRHDEDVVLEVDGVTSQPVRLRYLLHQIRGVRRAIVTEIRDFRPVGALRLPHRLSLYYSALDSPRAASTQLSAPTEEFLFETIEINPPLTPADFKK